MSDEGLKGESSETYVIESLSLTGIGHFVANKKTAPPAGEEILKKKAS